MGGESGVLFDMSFFIWVGVLLFNVITGLVVDAFGALRTEGLQRRNILTNQCFICGYSRTQYDDLGMPSTAPSFDEHCTEEALIIASMLSTEVLAALPEIHNAPHTTHTRTAHR